MKISDYTKTNIIIFFSLILYSILILTATITLKNSCMSLPAFIFFNIMALGIYSVAGSLLIINFSISDKDYYKRYIPMAIIFLSIIAYIYSTKEVFREEIKTIKVEKNNKCIEKKEKFIINGYFETTKLPNKNEEMLARYKLLGVKIPISTRIIKKDKK